MEFEEKIINETNEEKKVKKVTKKGKKPKKSPKVKRKKKHKATHIILIIFMVLGIAFVTLGFSFCLYIVFTAPEFTIDRLYNQEVSSIYDKDWNLITRLGEENRILKTYDEFPQVLIDALIATEDSRFFQHNGFDAGRFLKASLGQARGNSDAGGASTITMQLVKQNFTSSESSGIEGIIRKFTDIYMAIFKIEKTYTKQEIIEFYFNSMWLAGGGTNFKSINGVEQACQYYFGKSVSDITLAEAAIIVGMYNNPNYFNPYTNPENAEARRSTVLSLMVRHGYITEEEKEAAEKIPVKSLLRADIGVESASPYQQLVDYVYNDLKDNYGINIYTGSYAVRTTFDLKIQDIVNDVQNGAAWKFRDDLVQSGIAITSVKDGAIVAMGAGRNYAANGWNRAVKKRQPGSTAKPIFDYGPLIEYNNASPQQLFLDYPYTYNNGVGINNWDNGYFGTINLKYALYSSRNIPALQAFQQVDPKNIAEFAHNLGIDYGDTLLESFSIGGMPKGFTPLESSAAYAAFARGGYYIKPYCFYEIKNLENESVIENKPERTKAMSEETAYMITDILLQATATNVGGNINGNLRSSVASKSGTSNIDSASANQLGVSPYATPDHWVNTYSPDYSISSWLGYDELDKDHYFTSDSGTSPRGLISAYLANHIYKTDSQFTKPSGITTVTIENLTLPPKKASEYTPDSMKISAMFKSGTEPNEVSNRFAKLNAPSNISSNVSNGTIHVSWNGIGTPEALDTAKVTESFNNGFSSFAKNYPNSFKKFYDKYMSIYNGYNSSSIGSVGYQISVRDSSGNISDLGWTSNTTYTYTPKTSGTYEIIVRSAYSIYKGNQSDSISTKQTIALSTNSNQSPQTTSGLSVKTKNICLEKGVTLDPKKAITVTYNGKDVTNEATIAFSSFNNNTEKDYTITYTVTYQNQQTKATGHISVKNSCSSNSLD